MSMNWWSLYGPFDPGEDDLPHMGQVISHYAKLNGLRTNDLAYRLTQHGLKMGERRMEQLLSKHNIAEPQQLSRRRLLVKLLGIPPILMGLAELPQAVGSAQLASTTSQKGPVIDGEVIGRYESTLATFWDSFYSSSVQRHAESVERWRAHIEQLSHEATGANRTHALMLLCRFEQLAGVAARDRGDIAHAIHHLNDAVRLAEELNNPELLAASLFRRAKTHEAHRQLPLALADINAALPYAQRSRDQLRGYVFQLAGELVSHLPPSPENAKRYRFLMEEPGRILRKGAIEDDKSFTKLSLTGYQQDRARGFLRFGDYDAALEALAVAEKAQTPEMTRWAAETAILRAHVFAATGEVEWACSELEEALPLVTATRSSGKKRKARQLYRELATRNPTSTSVRHLGALLAEL
jgi:tetratricopeptide (TPR) repeat protein